MSVRIRNLSLFAVALAFVLTFASMGPRSRKIPIEAQGRYVVQKADGAHVYLASDSSMSPAIDNSDLMSLVSGANSVAYSRSKKVLYLCTTGSKLGFEDLDSQLQVFVVDLNNESPNPEHLIEGMDPSVSPENTFICVRSWPNGLKVLELATRKVQVATTDWKTYTKAIWLGETSFLYTNLNHQLVVYDLLQSSPKSTEFTGYVPLAQSPDLEHLLVLDKTASPYQVCELRLNDGAVRQMHSGILAFWAPDSSGYWYGDFPMIRWPFDDRPHLYYVSWGGGGRVLVEKYSGIYDGVAVD